MVSHMDLFNQLNNYKPQNSKVKPVCQVCQNETLRYAHCYACGKLCCFNTCLTLVVADIFNSFPEWAKDRSLLGKRLCNTCLPPRTNNTVQASVNKDDILFAQIFKSGQK